MRFSLKHDFSARAVALLILVLPGIILFECYPYLKGYGSPELSDTIRVWVAGSLMVLSCMVSVAQCSPLYLLTGLVLAALARYVLPGTFGIDLLAIGFLMTFLLLPVSLLVFNGLKPDKSRACPEQRDQLNPKCSTCFVNKICAFQPGAQLDQYTNVIPIENHSNQIK